MDTTLTLEEHKEIARNLHELRDRISAVVRITTPKLPKRSRALEHIWKLQRTLDRLRTLLDAAMFEENLDALEPSVYYATGRERWLGDR